MFFSIWQFFSICHFWLLIVGAAKSYLDSLSPDLTDTVVKVLGQLESEYNSEEAKARMKSAKQDIKQNEGSPLEYYERKLKAINQQEGMSDASYNSSAQILTTILQKNAGRILFR